MQNSPSVICVYPFNPRHLRAKTAFRPNGTGALAPPILTASILAPPIFNSIQFKLSFFKQLLF
jgi:hypothetical protein